MMTAECEYFDSHAHFDSIDEVSGVLERALAADVTHIMAVGGSPGADEIVLTAVDRFPAAVRAAIGWGRDEAGELGSVPNGIAAAASGLDRALSEDAARKRAVGAIGEIGLDFHYERETAGEQIELFRAQLEVARKHGLPAIVHSREAEAETLAELRIHAAACADAVRGPGVLHCFTGSRLFAEELLSMGYCLSFSGIVTFRNASDLRDVAAIVPDDRLLIETDAPYLAPVPFRGKRNEPAYLPHIAATVAEVRGCTQQHIAGITAVNARRLFGLSDD